jgi:predicted membrane metal-binding protein
VFYGIPKYVNKSLVFGCFLGLFSFCLFTSSKFDVIVCAFCFGLFYFILKVSEWVDEGIND